MARTIAITQVGGKIAGTTGSSSTPPGDVSGISATGFIDPIAREIFITVDFTPPGGTWTGVHLYLDIPDHADGANVAVVGAGGAGQSVGSAVPLGPFAPIDLGAQTNPAQPWNFSTSFPSGLGLDPTVNIAARLYLPSISVTTFNELIQYGQPGASPSVAFTLVSLASGTPTAGTNVTVNCGGITCQDLPPDTSTGKSMTPFVALMGGVPANPPKGWGYRLYLYTGVGVPATVADPAMTPLTDVCTTAGVVPSAKSDLVTSILNSFAIQTPGAPSRPVVYAVAGLVDSSGKFNANAIVPGITNSCLIPLGTSSGTIDAAAAMLASIEAELSLATGKLGLTPGGINAATFLGATTVTGTLLATSGIITLSAQIGLAVVADANIGSCNVSKLLAGTATFSGTVTFQNSSGPGVVITSTEVQLAGGTYQITLDSSTGISIAKASGPSMALTASAITLTDGSYQVAISSSQIQLTNGTYSLTLSSSQIVLTNGTSSVTIGASFVTITQGKLTLTGNGLTTTLDNDTRNTFPLGLAVDDGTYYTGVHSTAFLVYFGNSLSVQLGSSGGVGRLFVTDTSTSHEGELGPDVLKIQDLPSSSPGAATKKFWYDPSDGNRVKFAA